MITAFTQDMQDRDNKHYLTFFLLFSSLLFLTGIFFTTALTESAKSMLLSHDETVASSLLSQGVSEQVIMTALTEKECTEEGASLLAKAGLTQVQETEFLLPLSRFQKNARSLILLSTLLLSGLLLGGACFFLHQRERLYEQACTIMESYRRGDYSPHLPQTREGGIYRMFSAVDGLATMLQAQKEAAQNSKHFLKNTISHISHQLKTPLAALSMYQEIMENEPDQPAVIEEFAKKTGVALKRMEDLLLALLKITRLDAGSIIFEKENCRLQALVSHALSELTTRAETEGKTLLVEGDTNASMICDPAWTAEALSNLVKNALDHTHEADVIRIVWDTSPAAIKISVTDNGDGIAKEDIPHIFKRFYRSRKSQDTQGAGLGLSLAKSIVEG
ncbi:MAG: HAMP domain-containing histidine kinase, partial [Lachnospiraceae bacterium]|nr:HAMP domain-containing histidine kinase [Lachnospiraceae bacterium]